MKTIVGIAVLIFWFGVQAQESPLAGKQQKIIGKIYATRCKCLEKAEIDTDSSYKHLDYLIKDCETTSIVSYFALIKKTYKENYIATGQNIFKQVETKVKKECLAYQNLDRIREKTLYAADYTLVDSVAEYIEEMATKVAKKNNKWSSDTTYTITSFSIDGSVLEIAAKPYGSDDLIDFCIQDRASVPEELLLDWENFIGEEVYISFEERIQFNPNTGLNEALNIIGHLKFVGED